jgi:hypothetical protein
MKSLATLAGAKHNKKRNGTCRVVSFGDRVGPSASLPNTTSHLVPEGTEAQRGEATLGATWLC